MADKEKKTTQNEMEEEIEQAEQETEEPAAERTDKRPEAEAATEAQPTRADLQAEMEALQESIKELEQTAQRNLDGWQRAQASFQNYRRRTEAQKEEWQATANAGLLLRLLPILDDFKRALDNVPEAIEDHKWLDGIRLVKQKLENLLNQENVTPIDVKPGDTFDPNYHEAILHQETEEFEDGEIVAEVQRGYLQGEKLLRPSRVVVAKAPPEPAREATTAEKEEAAEETPSDAAKDN